MTEVPRSTTRIVTEFDINLINAKVSLVERLKDADIDYDQYRDGELPPGRSFLKEVDVLLSGLLSDISPCDFADYRSQLLIRYTRGRHNIKDTIPQFYHPNEKERANFAYFIESVMPNKLKITLHSGSSNVSDMHFLLPYEQVLVRRVWNEEEIES